MKTRSQVRPRYFCPMHAHPGDTICALSTAAGVGAIAIVRLSGREALKMADGIFSRNLLEAASHTVHFGTIRAENAIIDEALAVVFRGPHSFTGEDTVEFNCHGSLYVQQEVLQLLIRSGARMAQPGEFSMRAYLNGRMDLSQAEAVGDLIAAESEAAHRQAVHQMRGGFSREISQLREQLIHFASLVELELDFAEEDVEFANRPQLRGLVEEILGVVNRLRDSFSLGNAMKSGVPVAILGAPNMGKSTLLNALLNEDRAIVSDIAGTTRDTVEDQVTISGIRFRFIDTAGIRSTDDTVEKLGIARSFARAREARIILLLFDARASSPEEVAALMEEVRAMAGDRAELILVANKIDEAADAFDPVRWQTELGHVTLAVSAKTGQHLQALRDALVGRSGIRTAESGETIVTNIRHYEALSRAADALGNVLLGLDTGIPGDLLAIDIRRTLYHLGEITGEINADDLLNSIFSRFCIGK
jgi:tRNA modification GTPase